MKKLLMLLAVLALVFTLAVGCSSQSGSEEAPEETPEEAQEETNNDEGINVAELEDGTYYAEDDEFSNGWKYNVTIVVKDGKIVDATWNGENEEGGDDKVTLSEKGEYGMVEKGNASAEWHEQAALAEAYLLEVQDPTAIEYTTEEGHTDAIAGATIHVKEFFDLAQKALASNPQ